MALQPESIKTRKREIEYLEEEVAKLRAQLARLQENRSSES